MSTTDLMTAFRTLVREDNDAGDPESLRSVVGAKYYDTTPLSGVGTASNLDRFCALEDQTFGDSDLLPRITYLCRVAQAFEGKAELRLLVHAYAKSYSLSEAIANRIRTLLVPPGHRVGTFPRALKPDTLAIGSIQLVSLTPFRDADKQIWLIQTEYSILCAFKE